MLVIAKALGVSAPSAWNLAYCHLTVARLSSPAHSDAC